MLSNIQSMKKIIIAIIVGLILGIGTFFVVQQPQTNGNNPNKTELTQEETQVDRQFEESKSVVISNPQTLSIPKLNVTTHIEHVGLDSKNRMDVPKDYQNVAWYELGYTPGETGSVVLAGHYDTPQGTPGVFYDLRTLEEGDEIIVEGDNKSLTYVVTRSASYPFDQVPLNEVFDSRDKKRLNLITCEGVFDSTAQNYSDRFVVYAVFSE